MNYMKGDKNIKRIISLALVLALCLCTMAIPSFAAGVTKNTARMITTLDEYTLEGYDGYLKVYPDGRFDITIQIETPDTETIYTYETVLTWDTNAFTCIDDGDSDTANTSNTGKLRFMDFPGGVNNLTDAVTYTFKPTNSNISTTIYYDDAFTLNGIVLNNAMDAVLGGKEVAQSTIDIALVKQFSYTFKDSENTVGKSGTIDEFEKYDFAWFDSYVRDHKDYSWQIDGEQETRDTDYMKNLTAASDIVATVTETSTKYAVTLPNDDSLEGNETEATYYDDYEGTIPSELYNDLFDYQVQYQPTDGSGTWEDAIMNEDEFTIPAGSIEGPVELQIGSKTLKAGISVTVTEFVPGDPAAIMLVEVTGLNGCNFDGNAMIKSTDYNSLVYLTQDTRIANAANMDAAIAVATELLTSSTYAADELTRSGENGYDVNCEFISGGVIDLYDASVAFAALTQSYTLDEADSAYDEKNMALYLRSDVDNDKQITVADYGTIKTYLLSADN